MSNVDLVLTSLDRNTTANAKSSNDGLYTFPNLVPGNYELQAKAAGFRPFTQKGITLAIGQVVHVDVKLEVGSDVQSVEINENASTLNFDNAVKQEGIGPETLNELPLIVAGGPRNSAQFAVLMPGVSTGGGNSAFDARINGGLQSGDEAIMDGVSMQEGTMSQSGMVAFADFRLTPDMVSEFKVLTSSYEPEYGASTGAQLIATTKSGTSQYHGGGFEYLRNKSLNATQFQINRASGDQRPKDNEHEFGGFFGGPLTIPFINRHNKWRTFFFTDIEFFRIAGGASRPTLSLPSLKERSGDFSDWVDTTGALIPIYDPNTTRPNPNYNPNAASGPNNLKYLRDQFSCNGVLNVICPSRISNSLAQSWFKYLPTPTSGGALHNYLVPVPVPDSILAGANHYLGKLDQYFGQKDHIAVTIWRQTAPAKFFSTLPQQIAQGSFSAPQDSWVNRLNWDHTFSPTWLNHFAIGYLNRNEGYGSIDTQFANVIPQIPGVASHRYPPSINFNNDGFQGFGDSTGVNTGNITTRPSYVTNDLVTWVHGKHILKFGGELRKIGQNFHNDGNESGSFGFSRGSTGLSEIPSGSPIASFLLGAVDNASTSFKTVSSWYARQSAYILHVGDTWKVMPKLSLNYGLRWDTFTPSIEKYNRLSFFDFGPNPDAGGRSGRLAFAGDKYGSASAGVTHPEKTWNKGFAPRIGIAYALNDKTVIRTGYGIFYTEAFYPGWGGGQARDGFDANPSFSSSLGGIQPAFFLDQGFPQDFTKPPTISPGARNGQDLLYRPKDANSRSYAQQWNFTIDRQIGSNTQLSVAYVGSKGTRLPSQINPLNALNPSLLSMGAKLNDQFGPNDTVVDGVPIPYAGWQQQMTGCAPSVAQALLPYPQFCSSLTGNNENLGSSTYHSLQIKGERRYAQSLYLLTAFTHSKLITSAGGNTQAAAGTWGGQSGVISPFEMHRNKALAADDVPNVFTLALVYQLPFGKGKQFMNSGGFIDKVFGGWETSVNYRASSGTPLYFRSGTCNVPGQFRVACIPALLPGKSPFAQSLGSFDPNKPLFDKSAFESVSDFNFNYGTGPRITSFRGFAYTNLDFVMTKNVSLTERFKLQIRGEAFNALNQHNFTCGGQPGCIPFNTDISSSDFGKWGGSVTTPRNIQLVGRLTF